MQLDCPGFEYLIITYSLLAGAWTRNNWEIVPNSTKTNLFKKSFLIGFSFLNPESWFINKKVINKYTLILIYFRFTLRDLPSLGVFGNHKQIFFENTLDNKISWILQRNVKLIFFFTFLADFWDNPTFLKFETIDEIQLRQKFFRTQNCTKI